MKSGDLYRDGKISTRSTTLAKEESAYEQSSNRDKWKMKTRSKIEVLSWRPKIGQPGGGYLGVLGGKGVRGRWVFIGGVW